MKKIVNFISRKQQLLRAQITRCLSNCRGEGYIDTVVKILICVVLGALLLGGLYMLFGDVVLPELTERIKDMFNYAG